MALALILTMQLTAPASSSGQDITLRQRRGSRRHALNAEVAVVEPRPGTGVAINRSETGLRVAVDCELRPGEMCFVRIAYQSDESAVVARFVQAKVRWARHAGGGWICGLELVDAN